MLFPRILKHSFLKNTLILTISTSIAQFLPIIVYPILSRIYTPAQFGALATFTSIICVLSVIGSGRYGSAILLASNDKDAANLLTLAVSLSFTVNTLFVGLFFVFQDTINTTINSTLGNWLWVTPMVAFSVCIFNCYNEWCVRNKRFTNLGINKISNTVAITLGKLLFAFTGLKSVGLLSGDFAGKAFTAFCCIFKVMRKDGALFKYVTFADIKKQAIKFINFPKFTMPAQLLNTVGLYFPIIILGMYFSQKDVGYFSMTTGILALPISIISLSLGDVFRQKANEIYVKKGSFNELFSKIFLALSAGATLATLSVITFLPDIFVYVLGDQWKVAGEFSQVVLPMSAINFVTMALASTLIITQKLKQHFYWQVYYCVVSLLSIYIGSLIFDDVYNTIVLYCVCKSTAYIYLLAVSYHYSKGDKNVIIEK